jgi:hypothetical protein
VLTEDAAAAADSTDAVDALDAIADPDSTLPDANSVV